MLLRRATVVAVGIAWWVQMACAERSTAGIRPDPSAPHDGGMRAADAEVGQGSPGIARTQLEQLVDQSSGVFAGTVRGISTNSTAEEFSVGDEVWRVHYDQAVIETTSRLGIEGPSTFRVRLPPYQCEGTFSDGRASTGTLSLCTGRDAKNSPAPGQKIVGFLIYGQDRAMLMRVLNEDSGGQVDLRGLDVAERESLERVWATVSQRWTELGRQL